MHAKLNVCFCFSVQRSNCYMVCGADAVGPSSSSRSNSDLEIGCLVDLATGLVSFTANGKELPTTYQVNKHKSTAKDQCMCTAFISLFSVVRMQYFSCFSNSFLVLSALINLCDDGFHIFLLLHIRKYILLYSLQLL